MKKITLAILFACWTLALAAQDYIRVNYQGERPTISDFAWALLSATDEDEEECCDEAMNGIRQAWINYREGRPQEEGVTLTVDQKNGFVLYESRYEDQLQRIEMCYWNEADKKHKLFAYSISSFTNDWPALGQFDGVVFYRYDNAKKQLSFVTDDIGFEQEFVNEDGVNVTYALPRSGKDITVTYWYPDEEKQKTLKWTGSGFSR